MNTDSDEMVTVPVVVYVGFLQQKLQLALPAKSQYIQYIYLLYIYMCILYIYVHVYHICIRKIGLLFLFGKLKAKLAEFAQKINNLL